MAIAAFVLLLHPAFGWAQETLPIDVAEAAAFAAASDSIPELRERSATTASLLSVGSLLLPVITGGVLASHSGGTNQSGIGMSVAGVGLLLGPSAGYFYGGCPRRALAGIGIRAGITALTLAAMAVTPPVDGPDVDIVIGGAGLLLVSLEGIYEGFAVVDCVRSHNQASRPVGVWLAPGLAPRSINVALRVTY